MIYLDYAATTPMCEPALKVYEQVAREYYGNTESIHDVGTAAEKILEASREQLSGAINAEPKSLFFTGSGSEANYLAIRSLMKGANDRCQHIITTGAEHSSVRHTLNALEEEGYEVEQVPLDQQGYVDLQALEEMIRQDTVMAAIHHANGEIGTIQPVHKIAGLLQEHDVLFHSDCVQTFGKLPINLEELPFDSLAVSGHKIYGPKGTGFCYINPERDWKPMLPGTVHEGGIRPGTVDTPSVAAMAEAADQIMKNRKAEYKQLTQLRDYFLNQLESIEGDFAVEGDPEAGMPHIVGLRVKGMEGQYVMSECNRFGVAISTGSACHVSKQEPSATMRTLDRTRQEALEFIRFSFGKDTTRDQLDKTTEILERVVQEHYGKIYGKKATT